jgi:hypothetical protein
LAARALPSSDFGPVALRALARRAAHGEGLSLDLVVDMFGSLNNGCDEPSVQRAVVAPRGDPHCPLGSFPAPKFIPEFQK